MFAFSKDIFPCIQIVPTGTLQGRWKAARLVSFAGVLLELEPLDHLSTAPKGSSLRIRLGCGPVPANGLAKNIHSIGHRFSEEFPARPILAIVCRAV